MSDAGANGAGPAPKCAECQVEEAYYAKAWKCYSKFCSADCQNDNEEYVKALTMVKQRIAKGAGNPSSHYEEHDIQPPRCTKCRSRSRYFDFNLQQYLPLCGKSECENRELPAQGMPGGQQYSNQYGVQPVQFQQPGGLQSFQQQQVVTKRRANWVEPTAETRRAQYTARPTGPNTKCAHCCRLPSSPATSQGLFCSPQCEQREDSVMGAGVLVCTADKCVVILGLMSRGPYAGLYSFFHDQKRPDELARNACIRIGGDQIAHKLNVTNLQPYTLAKHSTPNVFSYIVIYMSKEDLIKTLPPNDPTVPVAHFFVQEFVNAQLDSDGPKGTVLDVFRRRLPVSRMTLQVIRQVLLSGS